MGSLDDNGIYIYDETDQISPIHTYSNLGQASTSAAIEYLHEHTLIMPVANAAERDAYASDMASAGRPASTARPLWVERADTGGVERNTGAGWHRMIDNRLQDASAAMNSWEPNYWMLDNTLYKKNGWVFFQLRQQRLSTPISGTSSGAVPTIPSAYRPHRNIYGPAYIHRRNSYQRAIRATIFTSGVVRLTDLAMSVNNWVNGTFTWPARD